MKMKLSLVLALCLGTVLSAVATDKKIILIAGRPSHPPGMHEFNAGCLLLKKCLDQVPGVKAEVYNLGWPKDNSVFNGADAVFIYADGGAKHPAFQEDHAEVLRGLVKKGVGIGFGHYGVEVVKGEPGDTMQEWIGGYYENAFSVNPMWKPDFKNFPKHPITRGVGPFSTLDEWYFNMRFSADLKGVTPLLVDKPSDTVRGGPYVAPKGPYPHIVEASGREEVMMWCKERPDGGRGFGFTGGHTHAHWGVESERKIVLNALLWIAKMEVPKNGVESKISEDDLKANLDDKPAPKGKK